MCTFINFYKLWRSREDISQSKLIYTNTETELGQTVTFILRKTLPLHGHTHLLTHIERFQLLHGSLSVEICCQYLQLVLSMQVFNIWQRERRGCCTSFKSGQLLSELCMLSTSVISAVVFGNLNERKKEHVRLTNTTPKATMAYLYSKQINLII